MISATDISYSIHGRRILSSVSCTVGNGDFAVLVGPNGAGKSTLLRILAGHLTGYAGTVTINGTPVSTIPLRELARARAVLTQEAWPVFGISCRELVMMGRYPWYTVRPSARDENICAEAMAFFGVSDFVSRDFRGLSGGEKQRVLLARCLAQVWPDGATASRVLFLDEPLTFLDIGYQLDVMHKLEQAIREMNLTVVAVVHDLSLAARFAKTVMLMHDGNLIRSGNAEEVFTPDMLKDIFSIDGSLRSTARGWRLEY